MTGLRWHLPWALQPFTGTGKPSFWETPRYSESQDHPPTRGPLFPPPGYRWVLLCHSASIETSVTKPVWVIKDFILSILRFQISHLLFQSLSLPFQSQKYSHHFLWNSNSCLQNSLNGYFLLTFPTLSPKQSFYINFLLEHPIETQPKT